MPNPSLNPNLQIMLSSGLEVIKLFSCSAEHEIFSAMNMKVPTIVGIFIFISREIFMLNYIWQG